jgi:hypothetical protein
MHNKRALGFVLIILGLIIILARPLAGITGFAIADNFAAIRTVWFYLIGLGFIVIGGIFARALDDRLLMEKIDREQERFLREFQDARNPSKKRYVSKMLQSHLTAPLRKAKYAPQIPEQASELPNWGMIFRESGYVPINKREGNINMVLTHYTDRDSYDKIKELFESGSQLILVPSPTGWAFFLDHPIKKGLKKVGLIRQALGIKKPLKPKDQGEIYYFRIPITIPADRIWVNDEVVNLGDSSERIVKYAIAGGIGREDISNPDRVYGGKYPLPNEGSSRIERWRLKSP